MGAKTLEREQIEESKAASRRAFDDQAAEFDTGPCGDHARSLYVHVLREVREACQAYAWREVASGRAASEDKVQPVRILDVGCGTGALDAMILDFVPSCKLVGVDLSLKMVRKARERLDGVATVIYADAERLPFADGEFDIVVCNDSFHHFPDPMRAAFESWRVLGREGVMIVGDEWQAQPGRAIANLIKPMAGEGDVRVYSEDEMSEILGSWFETVEWRSVSSKACLVVARK